MSKLTIFAALLVLGVAQGSLFGPFGPFGPFGQPAAPQQPGWPSVYPSFPAFGPPANLPAFGPPMNLPAFGPPVGLFPFSRALPGAAPAVGSAASTGKFRAKPSGVLERLAVANLPEDLQARYDDLLVALEQGNAACDEAYPGAVGPFSGLHRRCVVLQKAETERAAMALEKEASDRAAAESVTDVGVDTVV
ncbi:AAEL002889-PA [Aedes aegypti]|uniref:AAEL002889-PA n=1 Tax=Aedes aegypti TaxID=7159 RepID=Q17GU8_AEDAE|nr:AAEL002889-PA [Aedes aegypti]